MSKRRDEILNSIDPELPAELQPPAIGWGPHEQMSPRDTDPELIGVDPAPGHDHTELSVVIRVQGLDEINAQLQRARADIATAADNSLENIARRLATPEFMAAVASAGAVLSNFARGIVAAAAQTERNMNEFAAALSRGIHSKIMKNKQLRDLLGYMIKKERSRARYHRAYANGPKKIKDRRRLGFK